MKRPVVYPLTTVERDALKMRTARALHQVYAFGEMPVRVGAPCHTCGALFWLVVGKQEFAPDGRCLNCHPGVLEDQPALLKLVAESMLDVIEEPTPEPAPEPILAPDFYLPQQLF